MKSIKRVASLLLVTPTLVGGDYPVVVRTYTVTSNIVSCPSYLSDETLSLDILSGLASNINLRVNIYNAKTDALTYSLEYLIHATKLGITTQDVLLPFKNRLNGSGLKVEFVFTCNNKVDSDSCVVYPYQKRSIDVKNYRHEPYVYNNVLIKYDQHTFYTDETFDFNNLNEYLSLTSGNVLDLSNISFTFDTNIGFECGNIRLHIKDYANVFSSIKHFNGEVVFAMKHEIEDNTVTLSLDELLYVNEKTLEISMKITPGYVQTNSIYIPIGMEKVFEQNEVYITIADAGYSKTDITIPFTYFFGSREVGQCHESDYCITGGVKE